MTMFDVTIEDVLASTQVLEDVTNRSDSMSPEEAVEFRIACEKVQAAAKLAVDMINMQLVKTLDGQPAIIRDGFKFYISRKKEKEIHDHDAIAREVVRLAEEVAEMALHDHVEGNWAFDETQRTCVLAGAKAAAQIMRDLYISPSTKARTDSGIDRYGIPRSVIDVQRGAKEVKKVPAGGETNQKETS